MRTFNRLLLRLGLPLAVVYAFPWVFPNLFYIHMAQTFLITYIVVLGLNLLVGLSGQISLGHVGFYAIGAYLSAMLSKTLHLNFIAGIVIAGFAAAAFGGIVALLSLRSKGPYLAMVTIAFGELIGIISNRWISVTGGPAGYYPPPAKLAGHSLESFEYLWLIGLIAVLCAAAISHIFEGRFGRTFKALGNSEVASEVLGVNVRAWKVLAFAVSAFLAGAGGGLFAFQNGFISSTTFEFDKSILFMIGVIVGGSGTRFGPVVGTAVIILLPQLFSSLVDYHLMIFGGILLLSLLLLPDGIMGEIGKIPWLKRRSASASFTKVDAGVPGYTDSGFEAPVAANGTLLEFHGVSMQFGGLKAVDDVSITVSGGSVHGIIGPNGSGKSTTVNLLSGVYMPTGGTIAVLGKDVTKYSPHRIAELGMTRTFQNLQLFGDLTVLQNVLIGFHRHYKTGFWANLFQLPTVRKEERHFIRKAYELLGVVGLQEKANERSTDLSYGEQRLVEIARALALNPSLLILDEPAAGASPVEIEKINKVIQLLKKAGLSIVLVEHHMEIVMNICDTITVLDFGRKICEGTPQYVQQHPRVIEAYLGGEEVNQLVSGKRSIG